MAEMLLTRDGEGWGAWYSLWPTATKLTRSESRQWYDKENLGSGFGNLSPAALAIMCPETNPLPPGGGPVRVDVRITLRKDET